MKKLIGIFVASMFLAGCGGSDGGSSSVPEARPSGTVSGTAFDGLILNGDVRVYSWNGRKGNLLGQGETDAVGEYSVDLNQVPSQPVLIEVTRGRYQEEASGKSVALREGDFLYALKNYKQGDSISTSLTFYTTIATGLAEHMAGTGVAVNEAIARANSTVSDMIGVDIRDVTPLEVVDPLNATPVVTDGHLYGFATASISQLTKWVSLQNGGSADIHETYNSIKFAAAAYRDISTDGLLDGMADSQIVAQGIVRLSPEIYRSGIAENMLVMANSEANKTGLSPSDVLPLARQYNSSNAAVFAGAEITPLDSVVPTISNLSHEDNDVIAGVIEITANVTDLVGLEEVSLYIDGTLHEFQGAESAPIFTVDTSSLAEGVHTFELYTKNITGGESTETLDLTVSNAGTTISDVYPEDQAILTGPQTFSAKVSDPIGISEVEFILDGAVYRLPASESPSREFDVSNMLEGEHELVVSVTNSVGTTTESVITFIADNTDPSASWGFESGMAIAGEFSLEVNAQDNEALSDAAFYIDGALVSEFDSFPTEYKFNTDDYKEGENTVVLQVKDVAGNSTSLTSDVFFDNTQPKVELLNIGPGAEFTDDFTLNIKVTENIGLDSVTIYIDGEIYKSVTVDDSGYGSALIEVSNITNGRYNLRVVARDQASLVGEAEVVAGFYPEPPQLTSSFENDIYRVVGGDYNSVTTVTIRVGNPVDETSYSVVGMSNVTQIGPGVLRLESSPCEGFFPRDKTFTVQDSRGLQSKITVRGMACNNFQ